MLTVLTPPIFAYYSYQALAEDGSTPVIRHIAITEYVVNTITFSLAVAGNSTVVLLAWIRGWVTMALLYFSLLPSSVCCEVDGLLAFVKSLVVVALTP